MKLVSARKGPWELYDLDKDPTELNDLSSDMPETTEKFRKPFVSMLIKDRFNEDSAEVNNYIAPWSTRSFDKNNMKKGDPNPAETHPVWKQQPVVKLR